MNKKALTETDIRTKFITPAILGVHGEKWDQSQIAEERYFTKGRVIVRGKTAAAEVVAMPFVAQRYYRKPKA